MAVKDSIRRNGRVPVVVALLLAVFAIAVVTRWDWLQTADPTQRDSNSATLRNVVLVIAALIAVPLALWRSWVAERQVRVAQSGLLNERYQKGAEMLGSGVPSVRLGGIYALRILAEEHPRRYGVQVLRLFAAFVRHPTREERPTGVLEPRSDVQAIMEAVGSYDRSGLALGRGVLDFHGADLEFVDLSYKDLSGANLMEANLFCANLQGANLAGAILSDANVSGAQLDSVKGLTQSQLASARADGLNPPDLTHYSRDSVTGAQLEWAGKPLARH